MEEQEQWPEHARFMNELASSGFILGCPLGDGERILLVIEAESAEVVSSRLAADPWSATGLLEIVGIDPWSILLDGRG